jgi:hypothetical protein
MSRVYELVYLRTEALFNYRTGRSTHALLDHCRYR